VRDNTHLRKGQISTAALRNEFRHDPRLPMLVGDANFIALVRKGIDEEAYVYRAGDLLLGKGDPWADIRIDENALAYTTAYAKQQGIWPRGAPPVPRPTAPQIPPVLPPGSAGPATTHPPAPEVLRFTEEARKPPTGWGWRCTGAPPPGAGGAALPACRTAMF
jgi:hypothetical protein